MKDWIIKKLGGYTRAEVGGLLLAFDEYTKSVDKSISDLADMVEKVNVWNGATKVDSVNVVPMSKEVH